MTIKTWQEIRADFSERPTMRLAYEVHSRYGVDTWRGTFATRPEAEAAASALERGRVVRRVIPADAHKQLPRRSPMLRA